MHDHPLTPILRRAAAGEFPAGDGAVEIVPRLDGHAVAGVFAFTAHHVVAADVDAGEIEARLAARGLSGPVSADFLVWLGERVGRGPASFDVLFAGHGEEGESGVDLVPTRDVEDHPRVSRAARHRTDTRVFRDPSGPALLIVGRGVVGRWEASFEVGPEARGRGLGRALAAAARQLVPPEEALFLQVAPGNAASLRAVLAAGYPPIGAEVLFWR